MTPLGAMEADRAPPLVMTSQREEGVRPDERG